MSSRNSLESILVACLLTVGFLGTASVANAASFGPSILKPGESARNNNVIEIEYRGRGKQLYLPIVPYIAYDYPYYYRRGFYPTHIGRGYVYYGYPYSYYSRSYYRGPKPLRRQKARRN
jgi:hypothetical protein